MLADFHWLRPEWLWALPLVALITFAMTRRELAPGNWQRIVDPALAPYVLSRAASRRHSYRWWLMALGGAIAVFSLAGPSWNRVELPVFRSEQAMVIALDLSRSMDAQAAQEWPDCTRRLFRQCVYGDTVDDRCRYGYCAR
jgi:Ca-activated chloride channel family protein